MHNLAQAQSAALDTANYTIRFNATDPTSVSVSANFVTDKALTVRQGAADHLPLGWVTFIRDLTVTSGSGRQMPAPDSARGWSLALPSRSSISLKYRVDLAYARTPWPPGNEQGGEWEDGALYTVTKPLFITGDASGPSIVRIEIPAGWAVASPWKPYSNVPHAYIAETVEDLVNNSIVVGKFSSVHLRQGPFDFTVALLGKMREDSALVARTLPSVAKQYATIFYRMPGTTYLMTLFYGSEDDGESFERSSAFRTVDRIKPGNAILWANTLAHELFHFWNGGMIDGSDDVEKQWFVEGVTEYYANRSLLRAGAITPEAFITKAQAMSGLYTYFRTQPMFDSISVLKSGQRKTRYRFGIYNGGWSVAFALDQELRDATRGCRSLDDVMRTLFETFGSTRRKYNEADIERVVSQVAARDESEFFRKYVSGFELIPMTVVFKKAGLDASFIPYAGEAYIHRLASLTKGQQEEWRALAVQQRVPAEQGRRCA